MPQAIDPEDESRTPVARRNFQVRFLSKSIILSTLFVLGLTEQRILENIVGRGTVEGEGKEFSEVLNC